MNLFKGLIVIAILSLFTISCKKTPERAKEDLKDAVENAETVVDESVENIKDATEDVQDAANDVVKAAGIKVNYPKDIELQNKVNNSILLIAKENPNIEKMFNSAYGYAVFPKITKGGLIIGGAGGHGLVFAENKVIGSATLMQATIGAQIGGQQYSEYIFFENKDALNRFKNKKFKFSGGISAVAIDNAVSENINYHDGVAVYTYSNKGLMAEAAIGTQKFKYKDGIK